MKTKSSRSHRVRVRLQADRVEPAKEVRRAARAPFVQDLPPELIQLIFSQLPRNASLLLASSSHVHLLAHAEFVRCTPVEWRLREPTYIYDCLQPDSNIYGDKWTRELHGLHQRFITAHCPASLWLISIRVNIWGARLNQVLDALGFQSWGRSVHTTENDRARFFNAVICGNGTDVSPQRPKDLDRRTAVTTPAVGHEIAQRRSQARSNVRHIIVPACCMCIRYY